MLSRKRRISVPMILIALALLLATSCAKQDLYEVPGAPYTQVGRLALPSENEDVATLERTAFVAGGQAGLHTIDFSDPAHPALLSTVNTLKYSESVNAVRTFVDHTLQDIALVVEGTEGVTSYDVTDPTEVSSFNTSTTAVFGNRLFVDQPADPNEPFIAYLAESWKGVRVFESIPEDPGILEYNGVFSGTNGYAEGIAVKDGFAYVADDEMGVAVLDVRILDLDAVQLVGWCDSPGTALDIAVQGDYAYVADGDEGLAVFSIDGGNDPVRIAQLPLEGTCRALAVHGDIAVLAAQGAGVHFVDISDPRSPKFLGRLLTSYAMDLTFSYEGILLVVDRDDGLLIMMSNDDFPDTIPPAPVTNLAAEPYGVGSVLLSWYTTGDDRFEGVARELQIRHSGEPIVDEATWGSAVAVSPPAPGSPGQRQELVIENLGVGLDRYFAVRVGDDAGNLSEVSNSALAQPGEGILLIDPVVDRPVGHNGSEFTFEAEFAYPDDPVQHDVFIDGQPHPMQLVAEKIESRIYRYTTSLSPGAHEYYFRFAVADVAVDPVQTEVQQGPFVGAIVFTAGSPDTELGRSADEWRHTVVLSDSLVAGTLEITQGDWLLAGLTNPSQFDGANLPVENVTWLDAIRYCNERSGDDGYTPVYAIQGADVTWNRDADGWRLPTEAEWEWLARAGTTTALPGGDLTLRVCNVDPVLNAIAWYCGSFGEETPGTRDGGLKSAGPRGHFDLAGNVAEWCWDWYGEYESLDEHGQGILIDPVGPPIGTERVVRGGSWYLAAEDCRAAARHRRYPDSTDNTIGLRVVRTIFTD